MRKEKIIIKEGKRYTNYIYKKACIVSVRGRSFGFGRILLEAGKKKSSQ